MSVELMSVELESDELPIDESEVDKSGVDESSVDVFWVEEYRRDELGGNELKSRELESDGKEGQDVVEDLDWGVVPEEVVCDPDPDVSVDFEEEMSLEPSEWSDETPELLSLDESEEDEPGGGPPNDDKPDGKSMLSVRKTSPPLDGTWSGSTQRSSWGGSGQSSRGSSGPTSSRKRGAWSKRTRIFSTTPVDNSVPFASSSETSPSHGFKRVSRGRVSIEYRAVGRE